MIYDFNNFCVKKKNKDIYIMTKEQIEILFQEYKIYIDQRIKNEINSVTKKIENHKQKKHGIIYAE